MTKEFTSSNLGIACHFSLSALNTTFSQYATTCFTFSIKTICELYEKCESLEKYPSNTTLEREMQVIMLCFVFEAILIRNSAITYLNTNWWSFVVVGVIPNFVPLFLIFDWVKRNKSRFMKRQLGMHVQPHYSLSGNIFQIF